MAIKYVVIHPFHGYEKGQEVTDPDEIAEVLADNEAHVVRVYVPDTNGGGSATTASKKEGA